MKTLRLMFTVENEDQTFLRAGYIDMNGLVAASEEFIRFYEAQALAAANNALQHHVGPLTLCLHETVLVEVERPVFRIHSGA
jgi:hypothetical protein